MSDVVKPETTAVADLAKGSYRTTAQINGINESDVEIVKINKEQYLAQSVDTVHEEWVTGLYQDPYTVGWVAAAAAVSDMAAAGVLPSSIMQSVVYPETMAHEARLLVQKGFHDVCHLYKIPLVGGDTAVGAALSVTAVVTGLCSYMPLMRRGAEAGDFLICLDQLGTNPVFALSRMFSLPHEGLGEELVRPRPALTAMAAHRDLFKAAIDTSDSVLGAIYDLSIGHLGRQTLHQWITGFGELSRLKFSTIKVREVWINCVVAFKKNVPK